MSWDGNRDYVSFDPEREDDAPADCVETRLVRFRVLQQSLRHSLSNAELIGYDQT